MYDFEIFVLLNVNREINKWKINICELFFNIITVTFNIQCNILKIIVIYFFEIIFNVKKINVIFSLILNNFKTH